MEGAAFGSPFSHVGTGADGPGKCVGGAVAGHWPLSGMVVAPVVRWPVAVRFPHVPPKHCLALMGPVSIAPLKSILI